MARTSRKSITNADLNGVLPVKQGIKLVEQVENNLQALERSSMACMAAAAANYKALTQLWEKSCFKGIDGAATGNGKSVTDTFGMVQSLVEGWHKMEADLTTMWREAVECRSIDEFYNLQRRTAAAMASDWVQAMQRARCMATSGLNAAVCMLPPD